MARGMKTRYVCDMCGKVMKPSDRIWHFVGSKGELYFCGKCAKNYLSSIERK